jgi:hypothetical protein
MVLISAAILAGSWLTQIDFAALGKRDTPVVTASLAPAKKPQGSCATLDAGMTRAEVEARLGAPDEVVADEEIRGPGAVQLVYRASRCSVHIFEGRVEFID